MERLLFILILAPVLTFGRRNITLSHTDDAITVNGTAYGKDALAYSINPSDSTKAAIIRAADGGIVVQMQAMSYYKRSSGTAFTKTTFVAFCDSFMFGASSIKTASITVTGGGTGRGTLTVPSGSVVYGIAVKNTSNPTDPFRDEVILPPVQNVSGTTLTVYLQALNAGTPGIPANNYLVTVSYK